LAIPDYQTVMLPLLRLAADGKEHKVREAIEDLADSSPSRRTSGRSYSRAVARPPSITAWDGLAPT